MWRIPKLLLNSIISSLVFTLFILVLVIFLNTSTNFLPQELPLFYFELLLFYGPVWFVIQLILFFIIQFFAEKKYSIGIFNPPTITYFLSFTIFTISIVYYSNYEHFYDFFEAGVRFEFVKIILMNLILVILGIIFIFFKKVKKIWIQTIFLILLSFNIINSLGSSMSNDIEIYNKDHLYESKFSNTSPRKIRIVIMDGLSLKLIRSFSQDQKLLNFDFLIKNSVIGKISSFRPNYNLSLINSALTGLRPYNFRYHTDYKYKFYEKSEPFDIFPKYIFFRNSTLFKISSIYRKESNDEYLDNLFSHYRNNGKEAVKFLSPLKIPNFSKKELKKKSLYIKLFSDLVSPIKNDRKITILNKAFYLDDYIKNYVPFLKDTDLFYSITRLPGMGIVSRMFYQYSIPDIFGDIDENEVKRYGRVLENYYEFYDTIIGTLISSTGENELLVIMSFFEYEPLPVWRRIIVNFLNKKEKERYVYSPYSRGSIIIFDRNNIKKGYDLKQISISDIYPTLLYYSGFQLSKNLKGEVLKEIFTDDFLLNNPIDFVSTD